MGDLTEFGESTGISTFVEEGGLFGKATGMTFAQQAAIVAAAGGLPGDLGAFFSSDFGKLAAGIFSQTGGGSGFTGWLDKIGIRGTAKDILEEVLTYVALAQAGDYLAKDANDLANEYEAKEKAAINSLVNAAQSYSDPQNLAKVKSAAAEEVRKVYGRQAEQVKEDLYARGMGERAPGVYGQLAQAAGQAELEAMRAAETDFSSKGLQAAAYAVGPVQAASWKARNVAEQQKMVPFEFYESVLENLHNSPADMYYKAALANAGYGGGSAAPAAAGGTPLAEILKGIAFNTTGLNIGNTGGGIDVNFDTTGLGLPTISTPPISGMQMDYEYPNLNLDLTGLGLQSAPTVEDLSLKYKPRFGIRRGGL